MAIDYSEYEVSDKKSLDYIPDEYLESLDGKGMQLREMILAWRSMYTHLNKRSARRVESGKSLVKFNVARGRGRVLLDLLGHDGASQAELARLSGITPQTLRTHLGKLEEEGLVSRVPDENDKRAMCVHLTAQGRDACNVLMEEERFSGSMFEIYTAEELEVFRSFIVRLDERLISEINASENVEKIL